MAITRSKKEEIVVDIKQLMQASKLTLIVDYEGMSVQQFQSLRKLAEEAQVVIRVVKNNLMKQVLKELKFEPIDNELKGMLVYVFNPQDEVSGAQIIKSFAKTSQASLHFIGAVTDQGLFMNGEEVNYLASLAPKPELLGRLIAGLQGGLENLRGGLNNLPQILNSLKIHKSQ